MRAGWAEPGAARAHARERSNSDPGTAVLDDVRGFGFVEICSGSHPAESEAVGFVDVATGRCVDASSGRWSSSAMVWSTAVISSVALARACSRSISSIDRRGTSTYSTRQSSAAATRSSAARAFGLSIGHSSDDRPRPVRRDRGLRLEQLREIRATCPGAQIDIGWVTWVEISLVMWVLLWSRRSLTMWMSIPSARARAAQVWRRPQSFSSAPGRSGSERLSAAWLRRTLG